MTLPVFVHLYRCDQCGKCFAAQSYLSQHSDVHNAAKVHCCPLCPKRFQSQPSLSQHKATHGQQQGKARLGQMALLTCIVIVSVSPSLVDKLPKEMSTFHKNTASPDVQIIDRVAYNPYVISCFAYIHANQPVTTGAKV